MPCYNEADRLKQSVNSVFGQTFLDIELIVVDDGSFDNSLAVLEELSKQYPSLHYLSQPNKGAGPARNLALRHAKGTLIAFLDADDSWHPDCLQNLYAKLQENPDAAIAYCGWQNRGLDETRCKPFIPPNYETADKVELFLRGCRWPIHAALTKLSAIQAVGGFDEQWSSCMDYDLWLKIATTNKIVNVTKVLAFYHHHDGIQITKNRSRIALNHWKVQLKFLKDNPSIKAQFSVAEITEITHGELLHRGYDCYWKRELNAARSIFKTVMKTGYGSMTDWKYMLPALLPYALHQKLISFSDN